VFKICFDFLYKPRDLVLDFHIKNVVYRSSKLLHSFAMAYIKNRKHVRFFNIHVVLGGYYLCITGQRDEQRKSNIRPIRAAKLHEV